MASVRVLHHLRFLGTLERSAHFLRSASNGAICRHLSTPGSALATADVLGGEIEPDVPYSARRTSPVDSYERQNYSGQSRNIRRRKNDPLVHAGDPRFRGDRDIVFGTNPVLLALKQKRRQLFELFITEAKSISHDPLMKEIVALAEQQKLRITQSDSVSLKKLSEQRPHQGVCLECSPLVPQEVIIDTFDFPVREAAVEPSASRKGRIWLFLDTIYDPMNFGAILRSAHFFGVERVFVIEGNGCPLTSTVSKASAGAMEVLPVYDVRMKDLEKFFQAMGKSAFSIVAAASRNEANAAGKVRQTPLHQLTNLTDILLVLGNENRGVNLDILRHCHDVVTIQSGAPDLANDSNCLNVSVAAGVILNHLVTSGRTPQK